MGGSKDATQGGGLRKRPGLHYKRFDGFDRGKTASFLRNQQEAIANFVKNLVQYRKLG
jgi:hypothetical protein